MQNRSRLPWNRSNGGEHRNAAGSLADRFAIHHQDRYTDSWSYNIIAERLIAYNHGTINEVQVEGIERNLERIIGEFTEMKKDLSFLLRAKQE